MNLHERSDRQFWDGELSRELQNWAHSAPRPQPERREQVLRRASSLRWLVRGEAWRAWVFAFGRSVPAHHRASTSYLLWTYQTASIRLVI